MIDRIETRQIQDLSRNSSSNQPNSSKTAPNNSADISLQVDYARLINQATQISRSCIEAVQQAQELLQSGLLESREIIAEAAEEIIESGI
ncbi:MAG: hypothetical protein ACETVZ_04245 [Phycisphaerae bacterium]